MMVPIYLFAFIFAITCSINLKTEKKDIRIIIIYILSYIDPSVIRLIGWLYFRVFYCIIVLYFYTRRLGIAMEKADEMELKDMFESGLTVRQMSDVTSYGQETIYRALRRQGVDFAKKGIFERLTDVEVQQILNEYENPQLSISQILLNHGLTYNQLYKVVDASGAIRRPQRVEIIENHTAMMEQAVQYYLSGLSTYDITEATGISLGVLYGELRKRRIKTRRQKTVEEWEGYIAKTAKEPRS